MIKNKSLNLLIVIFLLIYGSTYSQNGDFGLWSSVGIDYKLNKKIKFILEQNWRLKENATTTEEYFTELAIEYELFKNFELTAGFRHITENDNQGKKQGFENHFRYQFDVSYKYEIDRFKIGHRFRYQNKNQLGISEEDGDIFRQNVRFRTGIDYNIRKWPLDPEFSVEIFNRFNKNESINFNKYRLTFGTSYNLKKLGKIEVFYRLENDVNAHFSNRLDILGVQYRYSIN